MEGGLALIVLLVIAIFLIPIFIAANSNSKISRLSDEIFNLKNSLKSILEKISRPVTTQTDNTDIQELKQLIEKLINLVEKNGTGTASPSSIQITEKIRPFVKDTPENIPVPLPDLPPDITETPANNIISEEESKIDETPLETTENEAGEEAPHFAESIYRQPLANPDPGFISNTLPQMHAFDNDVPPALPHEKKTNFEQFIGEKLISIVGITILVLGIFFSVKWAIDRHLISDAGKIMIGIASGTLLLGVAHKLVKNYRAFSSILAGGGIAVLYFSIYEAYQAYHLIPQAAAFGIMVFITLITVILSILYDKKELALIAIIGGFGTPFFVSNGSGNYQVLFTYLLILNVGMFLLANFKKWNIVNIICYGLTMVIFGGWVSNSFETSPGQAMGGMLFISLFFITFFGMHIIYNLRHSKQFGYIEIVLLLSNSFIYLGFGLYFLKFLQQGKFQGMFSLALSAFNFVFAYIFYRRQNIDRNLVYLLIGLVLTFLSLTGPLQLDGNYITLFWACEVVILYWMGVKTGIELLKNASILVLLLAIISLAADWNNNYHLSSKSMPILFNKAFLTTLVVSTAVFVNYKLLQKEESETIVWKLVETKQYRRLLSFVLTGLIYLGLFQEVQYQSFRLSQYEDFMGMMLWIYHLSFVCVLAFFVGKKNDVFLNKLTMNALMGSLLIYPIGILNVIHLRNSLLPDKKMGLYHWHYLMPILVMISAHITFKYIHKHHKKTDREFTVMAWGLTAILLLTFSVEAVNIWVVQAYNRTIGIDALVTKADKVALPIIWSIASLILMLLGMRYKIKTLRVISLTLFSLTIAKLFIYDISNVGQGGKIAAFIILGVILLIVSFMYQKIKGLFVDENATSQPEE